MKNYNSANCWCRLLLLLPLWLGLAAGARAQAVRVTVVPLPPYSTHLSDYVDQPNRLLVTLSNTTRQPVSLQLAGAITGDNGVSARTKPGARSPRPVALDALQTRRLDSEELGLLFDETMLSYTGISAQEVVRGNGLPEGTYTICVKALDYATGRPLSADEPVGCSRPFSLRSLEPPYIIKPLADEQIRANSPQNIIFTWSRPAGAPVNTEYELRIVEMSDPRRNPNDAFLAGTVPPLFERTVSGATVLLYGPGEPALIQGRRYAFAVTARDPSSRSSFRNNGRSEVQTFVYGAGPAVATAPAPTKTNAPKKAGLGPGKYTMPTSVIRGRVLWGFRASEEKNPSSFASTVTTPVFSDPNGLVATVLADPSYGPGGMGILTAAANAAPKSAGGPGAAAHGAASAASSGGSAPGKSSGGSGLLSATIPNPQTALNNGGPASGVAAVMGGGTTLGAALGGGSPNYSTPGQPQGPLGQLPTAQQPKLPGLLGSKRYPLASTKVRLVYEYRPIAPGQIGFNDPVLNAKRTEVVGIGTTNEAGEFAISFVNPGLYDDPSGTEPPTLLLGSKKRTITAVRVEVDNPRFLSEPVPYALPAGKNGDYDLGEVNCLANTYRLQVKLTAANEAVTTGVRVELLRLSKWYGANAYARVEGQLPEDKRPTENILGEFTKVTDTEAVGKELVRLFPSNEVNDAYLVRITGEGYKPFLTTLKVKVPSNDVNDGVLTVTKAYDLVPAPPVVQGRVLRKHDNSPVAGATVRFYRGPLEKPDWQFSTETDEQGRFAIQLITTNLYTWKLLITGTGVASNWEETNIKVNKSGPAGIIKRDPILIEATQHPLAGRVVSDEGGPVGSAGLQWKTGGAPFTADGDGRFLSLHQSGPDTLLVSKAGYQPRKVYVFVEGDGKTASGKKKGKADGALVVDLSTPAGLQSAAANLASSVQGMPSMQLSGAGKNSGSGKNNGGGGGGSTTTLYNPQSSAGAMGNLADITASYVGLLQGAGVGQQAPLGDGQDLGTIVLNRSVGRLLVTVLDSASKKPLAGAAVSFPGTTPLLSVASNNKGISFFNKAPGGAVSVRVSSPSSGPVAYVPATFDVNVSQNGDTTRLTVKLAPGARITGTITTGGEVVAGAKVRVQGRPELEATSSKTGTYELLGVPHGSWTLEATKSGLIGQSKTQSFQHGSSATVDFALTGAGFAIDKLLGFPIEIKEGGLKMGADTVITGAFVNLPGNAVFAVAPEARLEFYKVPVRLDKAGVLRPKGANYVKTETMALPLKAFKFLPISLSSSTGLKVQMLGTNPAEGQVLGQPEVDYGTLGNSLGWTWPAGTKHYLSAATGSDVPELPALWTGTVPVSTSLHLRAAASSASLTLYGFKANIDLNKSSVALDGLHLAGDVQLAGIPGLGTVKVGLPELWLSPTGEVKKADLSFSPAPSVSLGPWGMTLASGSLSEQGFSFGGSLKLAVPGSAPSEVSFTKLAVGAGQLYGGSFTLPSAGLDVLKLAKFKPVAGSPISFGQEPGGGAFILSGGAVTSLPQLNKELTIKAFTVCSDGKFMAQVPLDYDVDFASVATFHLAGIKFNTIGELGIDVAGTVQLSLPGVKAEAGGLHYRVGKSPKLDKIGLHFPLAGVGELGGKVEFLSGGFSGQLKLDVVGALKADADFSYTKVAGDIRFSTNLLASTPPILLGPGVLLTGLGGGFTYEKKTVSSITVKGVIGMGGDAGLALNPVSVTVASGPVISGYADLTVAKQNFAKATLLLDFPNSLAAVEIHTDFNPVPAVGTASAGGKVVISGKQNDTYWMFGVYANAKLLGLLDVNANVLTGWNLNRDAHPEHSAYTSFISPTYLTNGNTINGAHLLGSTFYGRTKENAWSRSFADIATGKVWFYNSAAVNLDANFKSSAYGLGIASGWGGGADLTISGVSIAGADVGAEYAVHGGYTGVDGWNFDGKAGAHLTAWFGGCSDACENKVCWGGCFDPCYFIPFTDACDVCPIPVGGKVCVHPGITMKYKSKTGSVDVGLDL